MNTDTLDTNDGMTDRGNYTVLAARGNGEITEDKGDGVHNVAFAGGAAARIIGAGRPVALIAVGTSGRMIALHYKSWLTRVLGRVPENVRILAFDLDPRNLSVRVDDIVGHHQLITLERDIEDHRVAPGTTFGRLMNAAQRDPGSHFEVAALLELVKDGFREINYETGAGGERLAGLAAWMSWSPNIRRILTNAFADIARLHHPEHADGHAARVALTVFVVGGLAGGTGAATLLPAIREAVETMDAVGIDVDASFITEIAVLPEAFPQTTTRLATTAGTFKDHDVAFTSGRLPGATETTPLVRKPDLALLTGAATEAGQTLIGIGEVSDVVGLACLILSLYPLRDAGVAALSNIGRRMKRKTAAGQPMSWGSVGCFAYVFPSDRIALYFAQHVAAQAIDFVLRQAPADDLDVDIAFEACHVADLEALMQHAQLDDDGQPLLGDIAGEIASAMRDFRGRPVKKLRRLEAIESAASARSHGAIVVAATTVLNVTQKLAMTLEQRAREVEERDGVPAGLRFAKQCRNKLNGFLASLENDRQALKERLREEEDLRVELSELLAGLVRRGWRAGKRFNRALNDYLQASGNVLNVGFALQLTDAALAQLADVRTEAERLEHEADRRRLSLGTVRDELQRRCARFEASRPTSVAERFLHRPEELSRLFGEHHDVDWDDLPEEARKRVAARLGAPHGWPARDDALRELLLRSCASEAAWVEEMTADDFLSWVLPVRGLDREAFIRDSLEQAALLWRYDAARLPEDAGFEDTTFDLAGVPTIEHSPLRGTTRAQLVATGDRHRLLFLRLKVGLPWIALWRAGAYEAAYKKLSAAGEVALRVYPDYPSHRKGRR